MFRITALVVVIGLMLVLQGYYQFKKPGLAIVYGVSLIPIVIWFIIVAVRGTNRMNRSIDRIQIGEELINIETFDSSMFFGTINRKSLTVQIPRKLAKFGLTYNLYGFDKRLIGDVYRLLHEGDQYLIESNFFEDFAELKENLENS